MVYRNNYLAKSRETMSYDRTKYLLLSVFMILLTSCTNRNPLLGSNEFSKYEKRGESDLEKKHLRGQVKEITETWNGEISSKDTYNRWGFYTERVDYEDGDVKSKTSYKYDEYGMLIEKSRKKVNEDVTYIAYYYYDDRHNLTKQTSRKIENGIDGAEEFESAYENSYDENGNLVKVVVKSSDSTPVGNYDIRYYDLGGHLIREQRVNAQGVSQEYMAYEYYATGDLYRTYFLYPNGQVHDYWEEVMDTFGKGGVTKRLHIWPGNESNNVEQKYEYNTFGDCIQIIDGPNGDEKREYEYDDKGNWIYEKEISLSGQLYDDNRGGSQNYAETRRTIKYY